MGKDGLDADILILPDGTEVSLGTQTILTYTSDFGKKERTINLDGEAFFKVTPSQKKPFKVITSDHEIEVLGTQFNVTAYSWDTIFTTTLLEGSVRLMSEYLKNPALLQPDQQYHFNRQSKNAKLTNVDASQYTKWISGYYYFPEQDLQTILSRLSHVYGIRFAIQTNGLGNKKFTGTFYRGQSIKDILEIINLSIPIKYKIDDLDVTIYE
ncbi:MAG: FecR family protein [Tannerellaceae bacterium]|nr:FecR family protein [Tannerellaceae bacterium]